MLFSALWAYYMATKTTIDFTLFQLVNGIALVILIECQIPMLHTVLTLHLDTTPLGYHLLHLECLNEDRQDSLQYNESHKVHTKSHFDQQVRP